MLRIEGFRVKGLFPSARLEASPGRQGLLRWGLGQHGFGV